MAYETRPGDGALFLNKFAGDNPKAPKWKGYVYHHETGLRIELAIWEKVSRKGDAFLSIKASEPRSMTQEAYGDAQPSQLPSQQDTKRLDDDIPF